MTVSIPSFPLACHERSSGRCLGRSRAGGVVALPGLCWLVFTVRHGESGRRGE